MPSPIARGWSSAMMRAGRVADRSQRSRDEGNKSERSRKEPDHRERPGWLRSWLVAVLVGTLATIVYLPASRGEYVWDDAGLITQNPSTLDEWSDVVTAFGRPAIAGEGVAYYRPVMIASFVADARLGGVDPRTFHRTNVLLHGVNVALIALLLALYTGSLWAAGIGALLFGLHPIQCQAVALILGRNDELLVPPIVGMLIADELGSRYGRRALAGAAIVLCFALTLWTKETGIVAPAFLILVDVWWRGRPLRSLRDRIPLFVALGLVIPLYFATRVGVLGAMLDTGHYGYVPLLERLPLATAILGYYVRHVALPWGSAPAPYHSGLVDPARPELWIAAACSAAFLATIVLTARRAPRVACGLLFFGIALIPVLGVAAPMKVLILDHRTYLPMVGIALSGAALTLVVDRTSWRVATSITLVVLAGLTANRLPAYGNSLALWALGVAAAPSSDYARNNYAATLMQAGRTPEAIPELREALRLNPDYDMARYNLAACLEFEGDRAAAIQELRLLAERRPRDPNVLNRLGLMLSRSGDLAGARTACERAVALRPDDRTMLRNLGDVLTRAGAYADAVETIRRLTELEPRNGEHWWWLGRTLSSAGRPVEAVAALEHALSLGESGKLRSDLGNALWNTGRWDEAAAQARRAQELGDVDPRLLQQLREAGLL